VFANLFFVRGKKYDRNTRDGKPYCASSSAIAAAPSKLVCGINSTSRRRDIGRRFRQVNARVRDLPQQSRSSSFAASFGSRKPERSTWLTFFPTPKRRRASSTPSFWICGLDRESWLKELTTSIISDPTIAAKYNASRGEGDAPRYLGGLLEHVIGLCGLARQIAVTTRSSTLICLLTAAILHDVGKLEELLYERAVGYAIEGQLLGNIMMEFETCLQSHGRHRGFPPNLKTRRPASPHQPSRPIRIWPPKIPMSAKHGLHYMDDLDSKLAAVRAALAVDSGDPEWSATAAPSAAIPPPRRLPKKKRNHRQEIRVAPPP